MALSRSRNPGLSPDRGSVFGPRLRRHAQGRTMGDVLPQGSRSRPRVPRRNPMPNSPKAATSSFSPKPLGGVPYTYDAGASPDNTQLNTDRDTPWLIQTHEHVRSDTKEFDMLRFSSSSSSTSISGSVSSPASAPGNLHLGQDKCDGDKDRDAERSRSGFNERLTPSGELRRDMRIEMKPGLNMRTGSNGGFDGAVLSCDALRHPLTRKSINDPGDGDGSVLGHVAGIEHGDMGGLESFGPLVFDRCGPTSLIPGPGSMTGVSGVPAVGSLTVATQSQSIDHHEGGEGEPEECGLLKSLLESSDPWGLMRKQVLNLPSPTHEEVERRGNREQEDLARARGSFGRRGVGYVTPPSMDALLEDIVASDEAGTKEVWEGGPGEGGLEDSQEILDFRSSPQPGTGLLLDLQSRGRLAQLIYLLSLTRRSPSNTGAP